MENKENFREKDFYRQKIIKMAKEIENLEFLEKIYYFIKAFIEE